MDNNSSSIENETHELTKLPPEIQLIKHVAREQALYNPKHEYYRNAAKKDIKWNEIGAAIGWTDAQCKAKWKAFRDQYCRELKRSKNNPKPIVKWKYFKYLEFLRPFALSRNYRPRFVPNSNTNGASLSNANIGNDDYKKNMHATIMGGDYNLLQNIKMEPKSQQDEQQEFGDNCPALANAINAANNANVAEQNVKNETIVVLAAEQFQHLNNVLQQQQQQQQHHQQQQQHHAENWSFLTNSTNDANNILNTATTSHQQQQQQQQHLTNAFNHNHHDNDNNGNTNNNNNNNNNSNHNNNSDNSMIEVKQLEQTSNNSADYGLLHNAIANCVAAAEADASQLSHQTQQQQQLEQQKFQTNGQQQQQPHQQQEQVYMFQAPAPPPPNALTSSDEEDDDPIHKFLNIESYFEKELIAMVQAEDILYNSFHPNYRNAKRKLDVWGDIARKMKKTVKQCRLKWKALRDQYIREHKRLRNRINIENLPRWKHYDSLNFLHNFIKHKSEIEEKKVLQLLGNETIDNGETAMKNQQQQQQHQLQLHPALIGLTHAFAEHQRLQLQQQHQQQQQTQYHDDMKNAITVSSSSSISTNETSTSTTLTTTMTSATTAVSTSTPLAKIESETTTIDENQSNSADEYDTMDIDNYIHGNGGDIVMHDDDDHDADDDDDDGENEHNVDENIADDVGDNEAGHDDHTNVNDNVENDRAVKNIPNYCYTNRTECIVNGGINGESIGVNENHVNTLPANNQQQFCQQQQSQQIHHHQQQQQHLQQQEQIEEEVVADDDDVDDDDDDENDHIMQVVSLSCDVVIDETNAGQLDFAVPSTVTSSASSVSSTKNSLAIEQHEFTEQLNKLTTHTTASSATTTATGAAAAAAETATSTSTSTNGSIFYSSNNSSNNNNNNNNNEITAATARNVYSAIANCADFSAKYDGCANSNARQCYSVAMNPPVTTTTITTTATNAVNSTTSSTSSPITYPANVDDDEVGIFFKAIAMKIRSVNLSPIEFTDLQIEVLRVINQSLRKN